LKDLTGIRTAIQSLWVETWRRDRRATRSSWSPVSSTRCAGGCPTRAV